MIGKTVSHYKILEKIGEGGMGIVYKAEDTKLKRTVALKFLPPNLTKEEINRRRFINEAQAASALDHPNICNIHEIGEDENGQMYICMAYYEGQTLQDMIVEAHGNVPLPINKTIEFFIQIAQGLSVAHEKNIIHRDIKPGNILITERGEVKIVDFGLAKLAGEKLTETLSTKGTIAYMAPEIIRGSAGDQRADIWSLGVLLFEMLTGHLPFKGKYSEPMMYAIVNEEPDSICKYLKDVPELLLAIFDRLLKKKPAERYQSISEMLIDLEPFVKEIGFQKIKTRPVFTRRLFRKKSYLFSVATIFIMVIWLIFSKLYLYSEQSVETSIAVLPFQNISPDPDQEYLLYGIASEIMYYLNKVPGLRVIPYTSIIKFKRENKTISEIGKELRVSYILDTRFQIAGNQITVIPVLLNSEDELLIWSRKYNREFADIFDVQDEISQKIAESLLDELSLEDIQKMKTQRTENIEAYDYYMKGSHFHRKRFFSNLNFEDFKISEKMFRDAIELDPEYIPPYIELARLYDQYGYFRAESEKEREFYWAHADTLRKLAYDLDPNSPEANVAMGILFENEGKKVKAFEKFKRAIDLNPNSIRCNIQIAKFLVDRGLFKKAFKYWNRVVELDPLWPDAYTDRAYEGYSYQKEYEKAESDFKMAFDLDPNHQGTLSLYSRFLIRTKKHEKAKEYCLRWSKVDSIALLPRAFIHAFDGNKEEAINLMKKYTVPGEPRFRHRDRNWIYLVLGMQEHAFEGLIEESDLFAEIGDTNYIWLLNDPIYENYRSDPRFQKILKKHKELYEENLRKYGD